MTQFRLAFCAFTVIALTALLGCRTALAGAGATTAGATVTTIGARVTGTGDSVTTRGATATATRATVTTGGATATGATASPVGAHSMLQLDAPLPFKQRMFAEAAAMHASAIRLDVQPAMIFANPGAPPDYTGLDEVVALAQQYHLRVVADLLSVPWWIANCVQPPATWEARVRCGTDDLISYEWITSQIVARADPVIRDWEIWNEPDEASFFGGTPQQYAWMLRAAHDAIKRIDPQANVVLGGISRTAGATWLAQVLATPGADAAHAFDIANVHERARLAALAPDILSWRKFLSENGFAGPLWVTEHGYPADPAYQYDPAYAGGEASQAAYLIASIPTLLDAGANEVFVTERDNLGGQFASEGLLGGSVADPPAADPFVIERPSYRAVTTLALCYMALGRDCPGPPPAARPVAIAPTPVGSTTVSAATVANPGTEPLRLGQVSLATPSARGLALGGDTCSGQMLEPAQICTVTLRYAPVAGGGVKATLEMPSDNGTLSVGVSAFGLSVSELAWSKTAFAATGAFDRSGEVQRLTVEVTNPLPGEVPIRAAALTAGHARGFAIASDGCRHAELKPGLSCRVAVVFRPVRPGTSRAGLTLRGGGGGRLTIGLRAQPFAPPAVTRLAVTDRTHCFGPRSRNQIVVVTDQPASVSWKMLRRQSPSAPRCRGAGVTHGARERSGRGWAAGHVATVAALRLIRGIGRSVARFALPVSIRAGLGPGTYLLSVTARNVHGAGQPRAVWVTVAP